jgi:F0F1-type ATP synthase assembly protein I
VSYPQIVDRIVRFGSALGAFLADIALFAGTLAVVWGGITWLGYAADRMLGTDPHGSVIPGQSGPFAMIGLIAGFVASLYAVNWVTTRAHRKR